MRKESSTKRSTCHRKFSKVAFILLVIIKRSNQVNTYRRFRRIKIEIQRLPYFLQEFETQKDRKKVCRSILNKIRIREASFENQIRFRSEQNQSSQANSAFRAKHICNYTMEKALARRPIEEATLARAERG